MKIKIIAVMLTLMVMVSFEFVSASKRPDKGKKYPSVYKEGIVVNGSSPEWDNALFSFNKQALTNYAIVNDSNAFFICLRIADEGEQMKVLRSGIDLRFNSKGKKKAEATLHFPIGGRPDIGGNSDQGERRARKNMHIMFLLQMQDMELMGFKNGVNGFQNIKSGKNGILAAANWDSTNVMVYEVKVPFNVFATDVRLANPLTVGIVIEGAVKPRQDQGDSPDPSQSGMQGNRGQGGNRPGGMGGSQGQMHGSYENQRIFEDDEIWQSIVIAKKE